MMHSIDTKCDAEFILYRLLYIFTWDFITVCVQKIQ